jgi:hypothetical protein
MQQSVKKLSVLLAVLVAACSDATGINQRIAAPDSPRLAVAVDGSNINLSAGNNLIGTATNPSPTNPSVTVTNSSGTPIAGATVTFTTVATAGTRSTVGLGAPVGVSCTSNTGFANSTTATTDASGTAVIQWCFVGIGGQVLNATYGGATVTFFGTATTTGGAPTITKLAGDASGSNNATMAGQPVPTNPTVQVNDAGTAAVLPAVNVTFTPSGDGKASGGSPTVVATNAAGQAAVVYTLKSTAGTNTLVASIGQVTGGGQPVTSQTFTLTGLAAGTVFTCVSGCNDAATDASGNQFGPKDPAVQITKADGTPVGAGIAVTVTYASGTNACGSTMNGQVLAFPLYTNAAGIVAAPWCIAAPAAVGTKTVVFSAGNLTGTIQGTVNADFNTNGGTLTIDGGSGFTCTVAGVATPDIAVTFKDAQGVKAANQSITFTAGGNGSVQNGTQSGATVTVTTNSAGQASVRYTCGTSSGAQSVSVQTTTGVSATVSGTATAGAAATLTKVAGDNQTATAGTAVSRNPSVIVRDQYGNPVNGVNTSWVASGNGTVSQANILTGNAGQGSVPGVAANVWTLSTPAGSNTLTVTVAGVGSVTFTATGN